MGGYAKNVEGLNKNKQKIMQQGKAEHKIKEALVKPNLIPLWNTAQQYREATTPLVNAVHRETSIPKCQIIDYLNNRKGFNIKTNQS